MKIAKWGNSYGIRIPRDVLRALDLKEGDEVEIKRTSDGELEISRAQRRSKVAEELSKFRWDLPADYKFDRDEANAR